MARQLFDNVLCVKVVQGFYFPQFVHNTQLSRVQADGMSRCARHRFVPQVAEVCHPVQQPWLVRGAPFFWHFSGHAHEY